MPGYLVQAGAQALCAHAGQAQPTALNPSVMVSGQPTVLITAPYVVVGCTLPPSPTGNGPCMTARWLVGSTRVSSHGRPLVVHSSPAVCAPTGTPLLVAVTQTRVMAQ